MKLRNPFRRHKPPEAKNPEINWRKAALLLILIEKYGELHDENERLRAEIDRLKTERKER